MHFDKDIWNIALMPLMKPHFKKYIKLFEKVQRKATFSKQNDPPIKNDWNYSV